MNPESVKALNTGIHAAVKQFLASEGIVETLSKSRQQSHTTGDVGLAIVQMLSAHCAYWACIIGNRFPNTKETEEALTLAKLNGMMSGLKLAQQHEAQYPTTNKTPAVPQ